MCLTGIEKKMVYLNQKMHILFLFYYLLVMCGFSVQLSSAQLSRSVVLTLCNPMNHSTPGLPVHHQLREFTQTHVHRVGDAIQPSHPLLSPSPPVVFRLL